MRITVIAVSSLCCLLSAGAYAQDWSSLMTTDHQARWNACYKETRLIHRTRNMSDQYYRGMIKEARRTHMRDCMTRAVPPRPTATPQIVPRPVPAEIAGWAANP